jgi:hypothetical protein
MNHHFKSFVELGKSLALSKGLVWDFTIDSAGYAVGDAGWNLTACVGDVPPPAYYLRDCSRSLPLIKWPIMATMYAHNIV